MIKDARKRNLKEDGGHISNGSRDAFIINTIDVVTHIL